MHNIFTVVPAGTDSPVTFWHVTLIGLLQSGGAAVVGSGVVTIGVEGTGVVTTGVVGTGVVIIGVVGGPVVGGAVVGPPVVTTGDAVVVVVLRVTTSPSGTGFHPSGIGYGFNCSDSGVHDSAPAPSGN